MSALITIALVVLWAVVLIPMWLRRHDETEESRSVDRYTTAMHTLSRREAKQTRESKQPSVAAERYGLMPREVRNVEVHVSGAAAARQRSKPGLTAAQRRRRTLTGLLLVTLVCLVAAVLTSNLILWAVQVIADLAVVAFVLHLRRLAIASASARRRQPAPRRVESADDARYDDDDNDYAEPGYAEEPRVTVRHYPSERPVAREASYDQPIYDDLAAGGYEDEYAEEYAEPVAVGGVFDQTAAFEPNAFHTVVFDQQDEPEPVPVEVRASFIEGGAQPGRRPAAPEPEFIEAQAYAEPTYAEPQKFEPLSPAAAAREAVGGSPWEPVPVPRPTYTMKPAAPARRRAPIDEPLLPPVETAAEMDAGADLEEILDRRWAVND